MPEAIAKMVALGANINTEDTEAFDSITRFKADSSNHLHGGSLLDAVEEKISSLQDALDYQLELPQPITMEDDQVYLKCTDPGSYEQWYLAKDIEVAKRVVGQWGDFIRSKLEQEKDRAGEEQRIDALKALQQRFVGLKDQLLRLVCISRDTFLLLHSDLRHGHGC